MSFTQFVSHGAWWGLNRQIARKFVAVCDPNKGKFVAVCDPNKGFLGSYWGCLCQHQGAYATLC